MKKIIIILAAFGLLSCNSTAPKETEVSSGNATGIFKEYLDLKNALVKTDAKLAKASASRLDSSLKALPDSISVQAEVLTAEIRKSDNIEEQRKAFASLSERFITLARQGSLGKNTFFVQHCPMALDQKGANWLSNQEEIKNPYFGDQMLECGEVKEQIGK